jgi:glycosyltransferase involved in cell wall biosynthesis
LVLEKIGGVAQAVNHGLKWCSHDLIFKMDSDDIMYPTRVLKQMEYMNETKDCQICGCQIKMFRENNGQKQIVHETHHDSIVTLQKVIQQKSKWFANHPTICFRKSLLDHVGGYCEKKELSVIHDYEWMLRILRIENMKLHNLQESLLLYRLHGNQLTHGLTENTETQQLLDQLLVV